ncbi:probable gamma-butyrobetaine dioxygenase isoform X2 [Anneissia japonica]|uniref:probable gamma-butyrobetaine dioxygenase isoform X2 n=1 Tax=Anneissia japonica TaxID=1529436 RepID=UPI001425A083|nr:probable gamma-butyrobetaine dioxygenase isoform X2 [Anneissia japonica]
MFTTDGLWSSLRKMNVIRNFTPSARLLKNLHTPFPRQTCQLNLCLPKLSYWRPFLRKNSVWNGPKNFLKTSAKPIGMKNDLEIDHDGSQVLIQWNESELSKYHSIWLRCNCQCDKCIQAHSGQKLIDVMSIPEKPTLCSAVIQPDGNSVHLQWFEEPDHVGVVTLDWLKKNCYSQQARSNRADMCEYKFLKGDIDYFDYEQVSSCKKTFLRYLKYLNEYGVCIIDRIPTENDEHKVIEIAERLGPIQSTLYGSRFDVKTEERPINIAYSSMGIEYHMDLAYYESAPGIQLLHCVRFDDKVVGGESFFLDIFYVVEELRNRFPVEFETLCTVPATFQKIHFKRENPAAFQYQRPHINVHPVTRHITAVTWSPPFEGILHVREEDVEPYYRAYRRLAQLLKYSDAKKELRLKRGQCAVFNNRRIVHGRKAFELNGGQRHMKGCYVNIDDFKSTVQVEHLKQGTGELARRVGNQCLF